MSKIRRDFWQLSSLIANISGNHGHVGNLKSSWSSWINYIQSPIVRQNWRTLVH